MVDFFSGGQHTAHPGGEETRLIFGYFLEALLTICWIAIKKLLWDLVWKHCRAILLAGKISYRRWRKTSKAMDMDAFLFCCHSWWKHPVYVGCFRTWCRQQKPDLMRCLSPSSRQREFPVPRWSESPQCQWVSMSFLPRWGTSCFRETPKPPKEPDLQVWGHLSVFFPKLVYERHLPCSLSLEWEHFARMWCCAQAGAPHLLHHHGATMDWSLGHRNSTRASPLPRDYSSHRIRDSSLWCLCLFVSLVPSLRLLLFHRSCDTV